MSYTGANHQAAAVRVCPPLCSVRCWAVLWTAHRKMKHFKVMVLQRNFRPAESFFLLFCLQVF